jgi:hypothetical protein
MASEIPRARTRGSKSKKPNLPQRGLDKGTICGPICQPLTTDPNRATLFSGTSRHRLLQLHSVTTFHNRRRAAAKRSRAYLGSPMRAQRPSPQAEMARSH